MMIIESVRSVAGPEEGKPYRKIKVSSDARTKLAPEVIRDAVSTYIREKVNHIVRGDCVVEVHWNGLDLRTLHLRSIQPLSPDEAARQRKETAARVNNACAAPASRPEFTATPNVVKKFALPAPSGTSQTASYLLVPASQTPTGSSLPPSSPTSSNGGSDIAQKKLKVVTINRIQSKPNASYLPGMTVNRSFMAPTPGPQNTRLIRWAPQVRQVLSSTPQVRPSVATTSVPVTVTGLSKGGNVLSRPVVAADGKIATAGNPSIITRNGVRLIVASSSSNCPSIRPIEPMSRCAVGPVMRGPVIQRLRAPTPGFIPPPGSRIIRMRTNRPDGFPILHRAATPAGAIRPSSTWSAKTASREEEVVVQPTIAPTQARTLQFPTPQTAQPVSTIAPVMTVRQIATSNPNLSVRVNGNVIRAVPGQVIRRVTGEIVRVLDNGSLEPVDIQAPPKTIVSSREKPISLDSETEGTLSGRGSTSDSDFEVIKGDLSPGGETESSFRGERISLGDIRRRIGVRTDSSSDCARASEERPFSPDTDFECETFDPKLLNPAVDFSEGTPFAEAKIQEFSSQLVNQLPKRRFSSLPNLMDALIVDEDGEMKLDPDLFEIYVNKLAIRFGYFKPPKPADSISYLFFRKPKPRSQCSFIVVPKNKHFGSANIARNSQPMSTDTSSTESDEEIGPPKKRIKRQGRRRTSEELLLDARRSEERDEPLEMSQERPRAAVRTRRAQRGRVTRPGGTEGGVDRNHLRDRDTPPLGLYVDKDVRVSEPVECFQSFVVLDRLKTPRNKQTVHLDGLLRTRAGNPLFEAGDDEMFYNLEYCHINRSVEWRFHNSPNPLRPVNDPNRGELTAVFAEHGIPTKPTIWNNVQEAPDTDLEPTSNAQNSSSLNQADPSNLKSEIIEVNPSLVKLEPIDVF